MMDPQQLQATIEAARDGSAEAYKALLEAYWPRLYGYFLRAARNHHEAEELLGELALRLVRQLDKYEDRGRFDHWLFRMAANLVRDRIRRLKVRPRVGSLSVGDEDDEPLAGRIPGEAEPVDGRLLAGEASERLGEALDRLEPLTREMILLRHYSDMSFKELARTFDCPIGTALARVHRGLKKLRRLMGDSDEAD